MNSILFLTTANLATNPRLTKELKLALTEHFEVTVIQFYLGNWSDNISSNIVEEFRSIGNLNIVVIDATKSNKLKWLFWGGIERVLRRINLGKNSLPLNALASSRRSFRLLYAALKMDKYPDFICAHNLGALYPAFVLGKKWRRPFIFDVEDYHPGEKIDTDVVNEKQRREYLMKKLLPHAKAMTSASPLICQYTLDLIGGHKNHQVVLNCFSKDDFPQPEGGSREKKICDSLKMVWYSQKVSFGRGLEILFQALLKLESIDEKRRLKLFLIGEMDPKFEEEVVIPFRNKVSKIVEVMLVPPLSQEDLHKKLKKFDIGLALEPGKDLNNEIAISNKIISYAQAGLYILATETKAQKEFINRFPQLGVLSKIEVQELKKNLELLLENQNRVRENALERHKFSAKEICWEKEVEKLNFIWSCVLD